MTDSFEPPPAAAPDVGDPVVRLARGEMRLSAALSRRDLTGLLGRDLRLSGLTLVGLRCAGADLSGADLGGTDASKAAGRSAVFAGAVLEQARFESADLGGASFEGASAGEADFTDAMLEDARFVRAHLRYARFEGALLDGADFTGADLWGGRLGGVEADDALFRDARCDETDLTDADLTGADFTGASLKKTRLDRAKLRGATLDRATLDGARLDGADLSNASLPRLNLQTCSLKHARLAGAWLDNTRMRHEQLGGAVGEELAGEHHAARDAYVVLEQNFRSLGDGDGASWAFRRGRRMGKRHERETALHAWRTRQPRKALRHGLDWLSAAFVEWLCDYGESLGRVVRAFATLILVFAGFYGATASLVRVAPGPAGEVRAVTENPFDLLVYSFLNMLSTSAPDIGLRPASPVFYLVTSLQGAVGIVLIGLFGYVLGNRMRR